MGPVLKFPPSLRWNILKTFCWFCIFSAGIVFPCSEVMEMTFSKNALGEKSFSRLENIHMPHSLNIVFLYMRCTYLHDDEQDLAKVVSGNYRKRKLDVWLVLWVASYLKECPGCCDCMCWKILILGYSNLLL